MPCGDTGPGGSETRPPHSSPQGAAGSADGSESLAQPPAVGPCQAELKGLCSTWPSWLGLSLPISIDCVFEHP